MARLRVVANAWQTYENVMTLRCTQSIWMSWIRIQQQCACVHRARKFSLIDVRGLRARGVAAAASTATSLLLERCRFSFRHLRRQCRSPGRRCPAPYPPPRQRLTCGAISAARRVRFTTSALDKTWPPCSGVKLIGYVIFSPTVYIHRVTVT